MPLCPKGKNFRRNTILEFLHENLWIAYLEFQETNGKIFCKKRKINNNKQTKTKKKPS